MKKLQLRQETLVKLSGAELSRVAGAGGSNSWHGGATCGGASCGVTECRLTDAISKAINETGCWRTVRA